MSTLMHAHCLVVKYLSSHFSSYHHTPRHWHLSSLTHNLRYNFSKSVGAFDYNLLRLLPLSKFLPAQEEYLRAENNGEEYWATDGVVPLFSRWHPFPCTLTTCNHSAVLHRQIFEQREGKFDNICVNNPVDETNHLSLVPGLFQENMYKKSFWTELGHWLEVVDALTA
ncbi:hypothetical protein CPB84DRAFT_512248 [Gymnopilus junonius]|uniref:Uncharacterized protein n=1 Tax=Gymnopilus junonius TaxID=109634 RepID=A0A9P5TUM9_GYMJU|nr:hypothetical protein CPB84DRAFT_512248 [Gymnopilus junonius]